MKLSFIEDKFVLQGHHDSNVRGWTKVTATCFQTKDINAAALWRKYADPQAERIFQKFMLTNIALPPGGVLSPKGLELYEFQSQKGIPHILSHNRTYLAHEPGLGKSAQAICAANSKSGPVLIVCPSFLKITWAREITKWSTTHFPNVQILSHKTTNWECDYLIVSDAMLVQSWVIEKLAALRFRFIFIDEAHRFKTPEASRTTALFGGANGKIKSPGLIYHSEHVCLLSGTPLLNRPIELWPMLFAMAPELIDFMTYQNFGFRYGGAIQDDRGRWRFVGSAREEELNQRIMGRFMQRITKAEVLPELPDKIRQAIFLDVDNRSEEIKILDKALLKEFRPSDYKPKELGDYALVRHENGMAKIDWVAGFVANILSEDENESLLLFAHHRDVVEGLRRALITHQPMVINGGVAIDVRTKIEDLFQTGRRRLIIGNIDSMNLGLTLTRATRIVFAEYSWTPSSNEQAEDRAHRIGKHDSILCQYLVLPDSIDEAILNSVLTKQERIRKVMK